QINPHFLFNAINTIVSYTRTQPDEARKLLVHLGDFFRSNLQEPTDKVPLKKEIEHIVSYVEIEKARHGDKLRINYEISPEAECEIPPLLLQPLVENAIKHGVLHRLDGGNVTISAIGSDKGTVIEVVDDGVGIPEDVLNSLLSDCGPRDCIGLKNVHDRLINLYGKDYGLNITSRENEGTRVRMVIPTGREVYAL
ncbi:MAG TPA: histidine kinase, partial [Tissierellaceae bacterium]|nr:histidine kinase [Tissierellaceae bacterium]